METGPGRANSHVGERTSYQPQRPCDRQVAMQERECLICSFSGRGRSPVGPTWLRKNKYDDFAYSRGGATPEVRVRPIPRTWMQVTVEPDLVPVGLVVVVVVRVVLVVRGQHGLGSDHHQDRRGPGGRSSWTWSARRMFVDVVLVASPRLLVTSRRSPRTAKPSGRLILPGCATAPAWMIPSLTLWPGRLRLPCRPFVIEQEPGARCSRT